MISIKDSSSSVELVKTCVNRIIISLASSIKSDIANSKKKKKNFIFCRWNWRWGSLRSSSSLHRRDCRAGNQGCVVHPLPVALLIGNRVLLHRRRLLQLLDLQLGMLPGAIAILDVHPFPARVTDVANPQRYNAYKNTLKL